MSRDEIFQMVLHIIYAEGYVPELFVRWMRTDARKERAVEDSQIGKP